MIVQVTSWFSFLQSLIWPFLALQLFLVCGTRFRQVHVCHDSGICSRNRSFAAQGHVTCLMQKLDSTSTKSEVERAWELPRKLILRWYTQDTKILQVIEYLYIFTVSRVFLWKKCYTARYAVDGRVFALLHTYSYNIHTIMKLHR